MRLHAIAPTRLRAVTHLDVDAGGHRSRDRRRARRAGGLSARVRWTTNRRRAPPAADAEELQRLGYAQELRRRMGAFSNFAISFSTICILAGGITSLQLGVCAVGGAAAGIVWPVGVAFSLIVALCMAEVASAFPTAGGLYHWSAILGGKGWGWATAWFNLSGLVFVTAAVNVGGYKLFVHFVGPMLGIDPAAARRRATRSRASR